MARHRALTVIAVLGLVSGGVCVLRMLYGAIGQPGFAGETFALAGLAGAVVGHGWLGPRLSAWAAGARLAIALAVCAAAVLCSYVVALMAGQVMSHGHGVVIQIALAGVGTFPLGVASAGVAVSVADAYRVSALTAVPAAIMAAVWGLIPALGISMAIMLLSAGLAAAAVWAVIAGRGEGARAAG